MQRNLQPAKAPRRSKLAGRRGSCGGFNCSPEKPLATSDQLLILRTWSQQCGAESAGKRTPTCVPALSPVTKETARVDSCHQTMALKEAYQRPNGLLTQLQTTTATTAASKADRARSRKSKQLTFVPVSAWLNNTGEEDQQEDRTLSLLSDGASSGSTDRMPRASSANRSTEAAVANIATAPCLQSDDLGVAFSDGRNRAADEASMSASTVERMFSLDGQSPLSNSVGVTRPLPTPRSPPPAQTPPPPQASPSLQPASLTPPPLPPRSKPPPLPPRSKAPPLPPRSKPLPLPPTPMPSPPAPRSMPLPPPQKSVSSRPPPQPRVPSASRATSNSRRQVLRQPSDVAALLHELLRSAGCETGATVATSVAGTDPSASKAVRSLGKARTSKANKKQAEQAGDISLDTNILNVLAKVIAERINLGAGDRREREEHRDRKATSPDLLESDDNICSIACGLNGPKSCEQPSRRSTRYESNKSNKGSSVSLRECVRRQKNGNNCYERPVKDQSKYPSHYHLSTIVCSHNSHVSKLPRFHSGSCECPSENVSQCSELRSGQQRGFELLACKLRASEQQFKQRRRHQQRSARCPADQPWKLSSKNPMLPVPSNGSNACCREPSSELFFERADSLAEGQNWKLLRRRDNARHRKLRQRLPAAHSGAPRQRRHRSLGCCDSVDGQDDPGGSVRCGRLERVNTASGTCSTEDAFAAQLNASQSSAQAACHSPFDSTNLQVTTEGTEALVSRSKVLETATDSPTQTDKPQRRRSASRDQEQHQPATISNHPKLHKDSNPDLRSKPLSETTAATALAAAAYTERLFNSLIKSRDESGFVLTMDDPPSEMMLQSTRSSACPGSERKSQLRRATPVKVLVPESMVRPSGEDSFQGGLGSSDTRCITVEDAAKGGSAPSIPSNPKTSCLFQPTELFPLPVHQAAELPVEGGRQCCIGGVTADGAARTSSRRSRRTRCGGQAGRRRSRIHIVEPLADAIQQLIELPLGVVERLFSSWRPPKYAQLSLYVVPMSSIESTLETSNQPVSLFCHGSGSIITADSQVSTVSNSDLCYGVEKTVFSFARRVAFRLVESLEMRHLFVASPVEDRHRSESRLRIKMSAVGADCKDSCSAQRPKLASDLNQIWLSGRHSRYYQRSQVGSECRRLSGRVADQDLELLRVTCNLAVRFRCARRRRSGHRHDRRSGGRSTGRTGAASNHDASDAASYDADAHKCLQPLRLHSLSCFGCTKAADVCSVAAEDFMELQSDNCGRIVLTHCPELVTNPNLALASLANDCESGDFVCGEQHWHQPTGLTIDTATSDYRSGDISDQVTMLKDRVAEVTDEVVFYSDEPNPLSPDGRFLDGLHSDYELATGQLKQRQEWQQRLGYAVDSSSADEAASSQWPHQAELVGSVVCDVSSYESSEAFEEDVAQRRSYNSHSFVSHRAAVIPGKKREDEGVLLSITCQLTVVDRARDSGSSTFDESWGSENSELVCA